jgi:GTP-binding protein
MDLPGLIEGTVSGKGLGTDFLKHTNRTKGIAHFLSFENDSLPKSYLAMRDEIASLSEQLDSKPEVIILTKHDLISSEEIEERKESFQSFLREENIYSPLLVTSVYDYDSLMELQQILKESREEIGDD